MNLGETLRKLIKDNINTTRPFFGYVIQQNPNKTWVIQPIDDQPVVNNVQTFQTEIDGNDPIIGSLVLCIFIDDYNSFITEIIEYDTWFAKSETSTILGSNDKTIISGKKVLVDSSGVSPEDLKQYLENNPNGFSITGSDVEEFAIIQSKGNVLMLSTDGNINQAGTEAASIRVSNSGVSTNPNDGGIVLNNETNLNTYILSKAQMEIISQAKILISGNGTEIGSNGVNLNGILTDILGALTALNTAVGTLTGTPPATANLANLTPAITTFTQ